MFELGLAPCFQINTLFVLAVQAKSNLAKARKYRCFGGFKRNHSWLRTIAQAY